MRKLRNHVAPISFIADWTGGDPVDADSDLGEKRVPDRGHRATLLWFKRPRRSA